MKEPVILITDRGGGLPHELKNRLSSHSFEVIDTPQKKAPLRVFLEAKPDLILLGITNGNYENDIIVARQIRHKDRSIPIICVAKHSSEALAIAALKAGIDDYFKMPFSSESLLQSINASIHGKSSQSKEVGVKQGYEGIDMPEMIGQSSVMREVKQQLLKVARTDCAALITGETGTGKELAARMIHSNSQRKRKRLICINCAAIPDSLVESELFGYERGAFTGAVAPKQGMLESAADGTAFLDEIGDMSPFAQAKILRTIELKEASRLGGKMTKALNFRVIAATNCNPEVLIREGNFRQDLYYRLNVARIHLPPLRDRKEDIPLLADYYIERYNDKFGRHIKGYSKSAIAILFQYDWPGNVRELKNLIEVSFINLPSKMVDFMEIPRQLRSRLNEIKALPKAERDRVIAALCETNWNKSRAAQKLKWSRMTLYRKINKYNISLGQKK
jgi:DNA-binding NtrC family response regulator